MSDQAGGFLSDIKKPYTTCKADCFQVNVTDCSNVLVGFMSKEWMKIDSESTFNGGSVGCTVGCAIGSVMKVALTGFGYMYWNIYTSETKQAPIKRLSLWCLISPALRGKKIAK